MEEILVVRELAERTPLRDPGELVEPRRRLAVAMRRGRRSTPQRTRGRLVLAALATAGMAVAISAVVVLAPDRIGGRVPAANADAARVLRAAATAALSLPDVVPRADQFVYEKSVAGNGIQHEEWHSVDGTRDGFRRNVDGSEAVVLYGCRDGQRVSTKGDQVTGTEPCVPYPAYLPDLPTDADAMIRYLNEHGNAEPGNVNAMAKDILFLMQGHYLRPPSRAALFAAASRLPGLRVVPNVTDAAGRPGIGVAWSSDGKSGRSTNMLVFDPTTYAYLGVFAGAGSTAVLEFAIVDKARQRP
jgi:hypothetical protein